MKPSALIASILLCVAAYSAETISAVSDDDSAYSILSVVGDMPIRNVIVKRTGDHFISFFGFQFDCASQKSSQTGFYSSPEAVQAELSNTIPANGIYSSLSDQARLKACESNSNIGVSDRTKPPSAS